MNNAFSAPKKIRWKWIVILLLVDLVGLFTPELSHGPPMHEWLQMVIFPFDKLYRPSIRSLTLELTWLCGPLLLYGVLLATVAQGSRWRIWFYSIASFHTLVAGIACIKIYRLW